MKWFSLSYWSSILMGRPSNLEGLPPSETSTDATSLPKRSKEAATSGGQAAVSTTKTKSTRGVSRGLSKKKQSSGTKDVKRRGRPSKKSIK